MFFQRRKIQNIRGFRKRDITIINKPIYENPYFTKKKSNFILRLLKKPGRILFLLIIIGLAYFLFYSSFFHIEKIDIKGNQELTTSQIRAEADKLLNKRRFLIAKQADLFLLNTKSAEKALLNTFALDEIKIEKRLPDKISITLKEKIPYLTLINQDKYFYLDLKGEITHAIKKEEAKVSFPIVKDLNKRSLKLGDKIIPPEMVTKIIELKEDFFKKTNTNIEKFALPEIVCPQEKSTETKISNININQSINKNSNINKNLNLNKQINKNVSIIQCDLLSLTQDFIVITEEGWEAYFTITDDIATQLERLKVYLLKKALDKESRKNIIYIDLRFGDKIYLKEK